MTQLVYLYDDNRVYTGAYDAQSNPEGEGFIKPHNHTLIPPPPFNEGRGEFLQLSVDGAQWVVMSKQASEGG